ncbi:MAG TPA: L-2-hydroxyglutarate oxidase [Streptosporangiaceae bacterium]|nr:L-2-hydroxyglutarate oxidase [Streptosporangiaceae bacterium]
MPVDRHDVAVVGAGIVGLAVARELLARNPGAKILVIDKAATVAEYQTGHNSGVIHAGVYYAPGSLKARLCVAGAKLMYEYCEQNTIPVERCGKLIVAISDDELPRLADLEKRAIANAVPGLRRVDAGEISEIEPECKGVAALHSPNTGIVDFAAVARSMERELREAGVQFALACEITSLRREHDTTVLTHATGQYQADWAIACAGLWSDRMAVSAGAPAEPRVIPFRGAYLRINGEPIVRGLVYPVPDPALPFLGVHVTRHIDGGVLLGPTALLVPSRSGRSKGRPGGPTHHNWSETWRDVTQTLAWPGTWGVARRFWRTGLSEMAMATSRSRFLKKCAVYVPAIETLPIDPGLVYGTRAQAVNRAGQLVDDFTISQTPGATHVRNAPSPAATSSLALAKEIVTQYESAKSR